MVRSFVIQLLDVAGILRASRYVNRNRPKILMYHRIVDDPLLPGISRETFAKQLRYLKRNFNVVPINDLINIIKNNDVKPNTVAITFDDGHHDFYENAWPLLKKYELPASIYVTTGFIDKKCWLWPDLLRYQLLNTRKIMIETSDLGTLLLDNSSILSTWNKIGDYCLTLDQYSRNSFLKHLGSDLGVSWSPEPKAPFSPLSWPQLKEMHRDGLDIGSHTVSHPILSKLTKQDLDYEVSMSYRRITEEIGDPPSGICYPNGMADDVSSDVERSASKLYAYGLVAYPNTVEGKKLMHLGRWGASSNFHRFVQVVNGLSRRDNYSGDYR